MKLPSKGLLVTFTVRDVLAFLASVTATVTGVVSPRTAATLSVPSLTEARAMALFWLVAE